MASGLDGSLILFERWYDKDEDITHLLKFLENIDPHHRKIIANELLQIIFQELGVDVNQKIMELKYLKPEQNKRWYDSDVDVQSSIEMIKNLSDSQRHELLVRIIETLEQFAIQSGIE